MLVKLSKYVGAVAAFDNICRVISILTKNKAIFEAVHSVQHMVLLIRYLYVCYLEDCSIYRALLTLTPDDYLKNVDLFAVAHSSAFVPPGSTRIDVTNNGEVIGVAYKRPDDKVTVIVQAKYWDQVKDLSVVIDGNHFLIRNFEREASLTLVYN